MRLWMAAALALIVTAGFAKADAAGAPTGGAAKPTIVLVHGAFADSSSWDGVVRRLAREGYPVIAAAVPLRSISGDAAYVGGLVDSLSGPVVLVGHSYGGAVISATARGRPSVKALVYVAAFAPDADETLAGLGDRFPTGTLAEALAPPVVLPDGGADIYIDPSKFRAQFAADVPTAKAAVMAATQRPVAQAIFGERVSAPAWRSIPSWFIWGSRDKNIPSELNAFMAERAGARSAIEIPGASHVVMISHPREVAETIRRAAASVP